MNGRQFRSKSGKMSSESSSLLRPDGGIEENSDGGSVVFKDKQNQNLGRSTTRGNKKRGEQSLHRNPYTSAHSKKKKNVGGFRDNQTARKAG